MEGEAYKAKGRGGGNSIVSSIFIRLSEKLNHRYKEIKGLRILKISSERCRNPSPKKPS